MFNLFRSLKKFSVNRAQGARPRVTGEDGEGRQGPDVRGPGRSLDFHLSVMRSH